MDALNSALHSAFVGGFEPYLKGILAERGLPALPEPTVRAALAWLDANLADLLELPFPEQRRSPLEIVQEAMSGPTEALAELGVKPPLRDPVSVAALPGDRYGLAPASSAVLGEEAFQAHLIWGAAKAQALAPLVDAAGRAVAVVSDDLIDISRFEDAVNGAGMTMVLWGKAQVGERAVVAFVDVANSRADEALQAFAEQGVRVIAYGPHVDEDAMARATALGASVVLPRSRLFRAISEHLPRIV